MQVSISGWGSLFSVISLSSLLPTDYLYKKSILIWIDLNLSFFPYLTSSTCSFNAGALVWAKLEGHPWWPCMVVPQPLTGQQMRGRGSAQRMHVHFFDEPPTRGWVSTKYVREYQGWLLIALHRYLQYHQFKQSLTELCCWALSL